MLLLANTTQANERNLVVLNCKMQGVSGLWADGGAKLLGGKIKSFECGNEKITLQNNSIADSFVWTKKYGKVKFDLISLHDTVVNYYLTNKQIKQLEKYIVMGVFQHKASGKLKLNRGRIQTVGAGLCWGSNNYPIKNATCGFVKRSKGEKSLKETGVTARLEQVWQRSTVQPKIDIVSTKGKKRRIGIASSYEGKITGFTIKSPTMKSTKSVVLNKDGKVHNGTINIKDIGSVKMWVESSLARQRCYLELDEQRGTNLAKLLPKADRLMLMNPSKAVAKRKLTKQQQSQCSIDELSFMGSLVSKEGKKSVMVQLPQGDGIQRIKVGDYFARENVRLVDVQSNKVIVETKPQGKKPVRMEYSLYTGAKVRSNRKCNFVIKKSK